MLIDIQRKYLTRVINKVEGIEIKNDNIGIKNQRKVSSNRTSNGRK